MTASTPVEGAVDQQTDSSSTARSLVAHRGEDGILYADADDFLSIIREESPRWSSLLDRLAK